MKKRFLSLVLAGVMALSLVACGGSKETTETTDKTETTTESTTTEETTEEKEEVKEVKDTFTYSVFSDTGTTLNYFTADSREAMTFAADYGITNDISVSVIARMPDVFVIEKPEVDEEQLRADLLAVVGKALESYDHMRQVEGAALDADLRSRGNTIETLVGQVEAGNGQTVIDYRTRLENKLREVLANTSIDESRILTEAAIFADKVAVDEETVRLRSHLKQMNSMLSGGGAVGRKLDFLLQEMNREANTIGSKCSDVNLARIVVDIKAELEKIREQTQNIE